MIKTIRKKPGGIRIAALILLCVLTVLPAGMVCAAAAETEYTIRIYSGKQGVFLNEGGQELSLLEFHVPYTSGAPGQFVLTAVTKTENQAAAQYSLSVGGQTYYLQMLDEDGNYLADAGSARYYPRGFRESGRDEEDNTVIQSLTLSVDRDLSYVVQYGVAGGMVKYTVRYLEQGTGKELLKPAEYYGAEGDKPVVSFRHVEGYLPNAYNEKKTITGNEEENVFQFIYHPVVAQTEQTLLQSVAYLPGGENMTASGINGTGAYGLYGPGGFNMTGAAGGLNMTGAAGGLNMTGAAGGLNMTGAAGGLNMTRPGVSFFNTDPAAGIQPLQTEDLRDGETEAPQKIIDLDKEELPMAMPGVNMTETGINGTGLNMTGTGQSGIGFGRNLIWYVLGAVAAGAAAAGIIILIQKRNGR